LVAIVVAGLTFAFGEGGSKRVLAGVLFGAGMAIAGSELPVVAFSRHLKHRCPAGRSIWRKPRIKRVHRSLSLTILGLERKLFFFAMCLGAATKNGHRFLTETQSAGKGQVLYHGFTKPREANHDADLYRLYQKAAEKIEEQGGRNLRVVLDYEMKKRLYRDLAKLGPGKPSSEQKHLVAERHGLQVVRGKIPVPDIRIEYEAHDGERARVDLELATSHYREGNLAEKVRAGFSIYAHAEDALKLRRVLDQRELTAEILSL